jgi:glycosyltransferase involved in cell wall biosynthesis
LHAAGDALLKSAGTAPGCVALVDGLAYGAFSEALLARLAPMPLVALVHHPLGLETGLAPPQSAALIESERRALARASHIVTTSRATAKTLTEMFGIEAARITCAEPGVDRYERARGAPAGAPLHIVSAGAVTARKGFDILVEALHPLRDLGWRATIAGSLDRDPAEAARVRQRIAAHGLDCCLSLTGALDESALHAVYASGDIFALATHYEGYGMVFSEAMAHGLPVVCSGAGAVEDTVPPAAGLHVPAGDAPAFTAALRRMITDDAFRRACADAAWLHARSLPDWAETARRVSHALAGAVRMAAATGEETA